MSQKMDVLNYMQKRKGITAMQAFVDLGITRLASRVYELRGDGHLVLDYWVKVKDRAGREKKIKRYVLQPKGKK